GCTVRRVVFTGGGTEAANLAIKGAVAMMQNGRNQVITSSVEHPAVANTCGWLRDRGYTITVLPVDETGRVRPEDLKAAVSDRTALVSIMAANNETGTVQPIRELADIAHENGALMHTDAVQAFGKVKVGVCDLGADLLTISAHKIYGPKGIGALVIQQGTHTNFKLVPLVHGGHQERNLRAGTENTIGIIAYAAACNALKNTLTDETARVTSIRDRFESLVKESIPEIIINGENAPRKGDTSNISFRYIEGESILLRLDMEGIRVSTGSACSTGSLDPSHVIMALHDDAESAHGSIRFSFGRENTMEEAEKTVSVLKETVSFLRSISPLAQGKEFGPDRCTCKE
ncbi:MAG: cysteine desulfurase family protein, partial [Spirochaetota bacterium]